MNKVAYDDDHLYSLKDQIDHYLETSSESSTDELAMNDKDIMRLARILKLYMMLTCTQRDIIACKVLNTEFTGEQIAEEVGISRMQVYREYKRIAKIDELKFLTPYKSKKKRRK